MQEASSSEACFCGPFEIVTVIRVLMLAIVLMKKFQAWKWVVRKPRVTLYIRLEAFIATLFSEYETVWLYTLLVRVLSFANMTRQSRQFSKSWKTECTISLPVPSISIIIHLTLVVFLRLLTYVNRWERRPAKTSKTNIEGPKAMSQRATSETPAIDPHTQRERKHQRAPAARVQRSRRQWQNQRTANAGTIKTQWQQSDKPVKRSNNVKG